MVPAVITFEFDPTVAVGGLTAQLETVVLAAVLLTALILAARIGVLTAIPSPLVPPPTLNPWELPVLVVGVVPGAVVGGRIEYVLVHLDYYLAHPVAILDPSQGGLGLGLAVLGGMVSAAVAGRALGLPVGPWAHATALPTLFVLAAGKLVGLLGATGQGAPSDLPWATAYAGSGPWGSLHAEIASHPSQVYEAFGGLLALIVVGYAFRQEAFGRHDGSALFVGVAMWAVGRFAAAFTWRDDAAVGPLGVAQVIAIVVVVVCVAGVIRLRRLAAARRFATLRGSPRT